MNFEPVYTRRRPAHRISRSNPNKEKTPKLVPPNPTHFRKTQNPDTLSPATNRSSSSRQPRGSSPRSSSNLLQLVQPHKVKRKHCSAGFQKQIYKHLDRNLLSLLLLMEGLKESNTKLVVYVHPSKADNIYGAVLRQLSTYLFTFDQIFDGILLAYSFELHNATPKILPGLIPYLGVNIDAKLLVLSPKPGVFLEGKVAKLGQESIHIVILGVCAAAITSEHIREEFVYKINDGSGFYASKTQKRHTIKMGTMVRFLVKGLDEEMLHVTGSLIPDNTGSIDWLTNP